MVVKEIGTPEAARFRQDINRRIAGQVEKCYQCGKCSAGCPIANEMDLMPNQVIRLVQLGLKDKATHCRSIWLCAGCVTCTTRCPQEVEIAAVMEALRHVAIEEGVKLPPEVRHTATFTEVFLRSVRRHGRIFEPGMVMGFNLRSRQPMKDSDKGPKMFFKGKLNLLPNRVRDVSKVRRIFQRLAPKL